MDTENGTESIRYAVTDIQGSVTEVYDEDNRLLWKSGYTAFGIKAGETTNLIDFDGLYTGCDYDAETGLTYHWNRWRSEDGDSWLTQDPIRDGINWYAYCGGDPINKFDPNGLSTCVDEKTGTIISAANDNDCGVYAFPTVDGQRVEGPGFPIGLTGTPGYFAPATPNTGNIQISGQDTDYIGQNISNYGSGFAYGDFQYETPINNANNVTFTPSTFSTWAHKKEGDFLTQDEANLQMAIGGVEMGLGFAGIFFTGGTQVQTGAFVMADGAIVLAQGSNKIKCTPFYHLANDFLSPNIAIPNYKIQYVSPLP
jgi:RHS repeat-associated protein